MRAERVEGVADSREIADAAGKGLRGPQMDPPWCCGFSQIQKSQVSGIYQLYALRRTCNDVQM